VNDLGILATAWQQQFAAPNTPLARAPEQPLVMRRIALEVL